MERTEQRDGDKERERSEDRRVKWEAGEKRDDSHVEKVVWKVLVPGTADASAQHVAGDGGWRSSLVWVSFFKP